MGSPNWPPIAGAWEYPGSFCQSSKDQLRSRLGVCCPSPFRSPSSRTHLATLLRSPSTAGMKPRGTLGQALAVLAIANVVSGLFFDRAKGATRKRITKRDEDEEEHAILQIPLRNFGNQQYTVHIEMVRVFLAPLAHFGFWHSQCRVRFALGSRFTPLSPLATHRPL